MEGAIGYWCCVVPLGDLCVADGLASADLEERRSDTVELCTFSIRHL